MRSSDTLGRATFHHIEKRRGIRPTPREIRWLKHIERHGPQSSLYLHEMTADTHRDPDTSRRMLQKLRAGGFLHCPRQQRATENANFNAYIYDLTDQARRFLLNGDLAEDTVRPGGHWAHQYMTACITSSIDVCAARDGVGYIDGQKVLDRSGATLGVEIDNKRMIPDQLFGLDYGGRYRFYCVEADRGTEPKSSAAARKSYRSSIEDYRQFIGEGLYKQHYGLTAGMLLLYVFSSRSNEEAFLDAVEEQIGGGAAYILTQTIDGFDGWFRPPSLLRQLWSGGWRRAGRSDFQIDRP